MAEEGLKRTKNDLIHSRPKYNSAISTFCWAVANNEEFTVNDRATELEVLYIDDLVDLCMILKLCIGWDTFTDIGITTRMNQVKKSISKQMRRQ